MASETEDDHQLKRKGSGASITSKGSKISLSSKLSSLVKRSGSGLGFVRTSRATTASVAQIVDLVKGDQCETISLVTVRKDENIESDVVVELPIGTSLEILEVGTGRRIKVSTAAGRPDAIEGWISSKTKLNEPLVMKRREDMNYGTGDFEVGGQHEVKSMVTMRADEALDSEVKCELKPGTIVRILEIGTTNRRRARVATSEVEGWISTVTKTGELLIGKVGEGPTAESASAGMFGASSSKIKTLLEAARSGDLPMMKKVVEGGTGMMSRFSSRPNLNASDIRGKTALIYAAAFGNKDIVEYLLTRTREVDVNALDDTQKSALHHASKRARTRREGAYDEVQAEIVTMLLHSGAYMEARDHNGCTALMFAVANGDEAVARRLLQAQANVNVKDFEGHLPLDYAKNFGHESMVQLLLGAGAISQQEEDDDEGGDEDGKDEDKGHDGHHSVSAAPSEAPSKAGAAAESQAADAGTPGDASPKKAAKAASKKKATTTEVKGEEKKGDEKKGDEKKASAKKKADKDDKGGKAGAKKAAKKGDPVKKVISSAMMEAVDDPVDDAKEVTVQELAKEEEDEKTHAMRKLQAVMESAAGPKELEAAIQHAEAAGASDGELAEAHKKVKELKARQMAREELRSAMDDRHVKELRAAIAKAEEMKVPKSDIDEAKRILAIEEPKQAARDKLKQAQDSGIAKDMKEAIENAKKAGLTESEIKAYEDLLAGAESKDKAEKALKEAVETKNVAGLKFAIQQAKDAGVEKAQIDKAAAVLAEEEPKQKAREAIEEALKSNDKAALKAALTTAQAAKLDKSEWQVVEEALKKKEEQERLLGTVKQVMADSFAADMTDVDSVRAAKEKLAEAIAGALAMGVSENDLGEAELRRKKLHNIVEDLKGSIRVFCRIRPLNKREKELNDHVITKQVDPMTLAVGDNAEHTFQFDAVFTPGTQDEIFEDCKDLVQSAVDGYNVTLFAYGQTGAGKTFTMAGVPGMLGVSPRTITEIFNVIEKNKSRYTYTVMGSMLELYRQDLVDLLSKGNPAIQKQKLQVRQETTGRVTVEHLTAEECHNAQELENLLERGTKNRAVAATAMNSESSRSHLVLMIQIISVNHETKDQLRGKILIVDLAGSERLKKSQTTADMQKESIEINKSLTALGDVIEALTKNNKVIPYRNHKLTQLMQDALGGSAKTLMFVNCSPASSNEDETLMSLKYAARAKKITNKR